MGILGGKRSRASIGAKLEVEIASCRGNSSTAPQEIADGIQRKWEKKLRDLTQIMPVSGAKMRGLKRDYVNNKADICLY